LSLQNRIFNFELIMKLPLPASASSAPCTPPMAGPYTGEATCPSHLAAPQLQTVPAPLVCTAPLPAGDTRARHAPCQCHRSPRRRHGRATRCAWLCTTLATPSPRKHVPLLFLTPSLAYKRAGALRRVCRRLQPHHCRPLPLLRGAPPSNPLRPQSTTPLAPPRNREAPKLTHELSLSP